MIASVKDTRLARSAYSCGYVWRWLHEEPVTKRKSCKVQKLTRTGMGSLG
jgi:hypothetical protein